MFMSNSLPRTIRPFRLARAEGAVSGRMTLEGMRRLRPSLVSPEGEVVLDLRFYVDGEGHHCIEGRISAALELVCQRCLGGMRFHVDNEIRLEAVVREEDAECFERGYEPLLAPQASVRLASLVEDELILALPPHPRHPQRECGLSPAYRPESLPDGPQEHNDNPFAVLAGRRR